jgi:polyribonucleotide nucleotidyltransferase
VEAEVLERYSGDPGSESYAAARQNAQLAFDKLEKAVIRERIAVQKIRPDGRSADEIRDITIEVGLLPRAHGSALFTRGQTQALSVAALGTSREEMRLDTLGPRDDQALLPPLQLPAVLGGRGRLHARPEAP